MFMVMQVDVNNRINSLLVLGLSWDLLTVRKIWNIISLII